MHAYCFLAYLPKTCVDVSFFSALIPNYIWAGILAHAFEAIFSPSHVAAPLPLHYLRSHLCVR
jgi:hypothetical protein